MLELLQFVLSGFWIFIGFLIILSVAVIVPLQLFLRYLNIRKHGWPPPYLDADGDNRQ